MLFVSATNVASLLRKLYHEILVDGAVYAPRTFETLELPQMSIRLENARANVLVSEKRRLNYRFMVAEWLWIISGGTLVEPLARYNSKMRQYSDDGRHLFGAYGPPVVGQWNYILKTLQRDPHSRQAVMTIWRQNPPATLDVPCTVAIQFLFRQDKLNAIVTMRSSDAWLGLPYDIFVFSQILNQFAGELGVNVGWLGMNLGSSHLYARDVNDARQFIFSAPTFETSPQLYGPAPSLLRDALYGFPTQDDNLIEEPWLRYGQVLVSSTSAEALEWLRK